MSLASTPSLLTFMLLLVLLLRLLRQSPGERGSNGQLGKVWPAVAPMNRAPAGKSVALGSQSVRSSTCEPICGAGNGHAHKDISRSPINSAGWVAESDTAYSNHVWIQQV